ncbi:MAG: YlmC/YmxH family sporulation protein [Eubacteriales bacterium]|jgi:YlmC/YmxH family sporulation protein|nr:YlmC/YmxH family sporulation protein [Eubacteriales bacterium]
MLSTEKLKNKEVINIFDGKSLGFIYDIEVNLDDGTIDGIVIPAMRGFMSFFSKNDNDFVIKWDKIRTIGDDVVLVEIEGY